MKKKYVVLSVIGALVLGIIIGVILAAISYEINESISKNYSPDSYYERNCKDIERRLTK